MDWLEGKAIQDYLNETVLEFCQKQKKTKNKKLEDNLKLVI